jgi:ABC-type cobalamin transport system ATPase subunit
MRQKTACKADGSMLVMSVDGKGVVMRTSDLREQTRTAARSRKHKMGARLSQGEKKNAKRMATVAAVYTLHQKRWVALVDGNKHQIRILRRMAKESSSAARRHGSVTSSRPSICSSTCAV